MGLLNRGRAGPFGARGRDDAAPLAERGERLASGLPPLLVEAMHVAATVAQGLHGRRRAGTGETFWQYRRYEAGDRPQSIDWRRSARADPVFVRELEWEAAQTVWMWADASGSMDYASAKTLPTKGARAALLTLALAVILDRGGERFALLDADPHRLQPPGSARLALRRLADALERPPALDGFPPGNTLPRHGHVVLFGDFLVPLEETAALVRGLVDRGAKGVLVQILDPVEEAFPFQGRIRFSGLEAEGTLLLDRAEDLRAAYVERLRDHRAGLEALVRSADWRLLTHHTDQPPTAVLMTLYQTLAGGRLPRAW
ncbi:DUF58 domain-containing protein [Roseospira navarrensis]|uniref:DUF58 domain-containing protein n=1 Tax=Roseospira navarrensis TaxID=140058 RepID=A0A7X1ZG11_9PROT|nr:DUF58 domain-containing protein [Roseospira navarrensis]MQX37339.1 DUF58 domain-containing protein [Roseospira navarrensis]